MIALAMMLTSVGLDAIVLMAMGPRLATSAATDPSNATIRCRLRLRTSNTIAASLIVAVENKSDHPIDVSIPNRTNGVLEFYAWNMARPGTTFERVKATHAIDSWKQWTLPSSGSRQIDMHPPSLPTGRYVLFVQYRHSLGPKTTQTVRSNAILLTVRDHATNEVRSGATKEHR
jgi:hypothetical protein